MSHNTGNVGEILEKQLSEGLSLLPIINIVSLINTLAQEKSAASSSK